jgi:hypothetical protein
MVGPPPIETYPRLNKPYAAFIITVGFIASAVTGVKQQFAGIHIRAGKRKIVFAPYVYRDPEGLIRFVNETSKSRAA